MESKSPQGGRKTVKYIVEKYRLIYVGCLCDLPGQHASSCWIRKAADKNGEKIPSCSHNLLSTSYMA